MVGFRVQGPGFRAWGLVFVFLCKVVEVMVGSRVQGLGFRVYGPGFRAWGLVYVFLCKAVKLMVGFVRRRLEEDGCIEKAVQVR